MSRRKQRVKPVIDAPTVRPWEKYHAAKRAGAVPVKVHPKLQRRFKMAEALLAENTPESRKRYKQMSEHSYGRDKHNLYGFWNGSGKKERKRPLKTAQHKRGITTLNKLRGVSYKPYRKQT